MSKIAMMAMALSLTAGASLAQTAPAPHGQDAAYARLVSKMDHAYNMRFQIPAPPEQTAARVAPAKSAG